MGACVDWMGKGEAGSAEGCCWVGTCQDKGSLLGSGVLAWQVTSPEGQAQLRPKPAIASV